LDWDTGSGVELGPGDDKPPLRFWIKQTTYIAGKHAIDAGGTVNPRP